jgi:DNA primase
MEIQEIKSKLPIQKVLTHYNLKPDRNNLLSCPFHEDKTPSYRFTPKQILSIASAAEKPETRLIL